MKILLSSIFVLLLVQGANAKTLFNQLCAFNPNWAKYETYFSNEKAQNFQSETAYIQEHLKNVLRVLTNNSTKNLSQQQLASRTYLLSELQKYRADGKFPINYYRAERIPVFIDEHNTHCAVGFLMEKSGYESLAVSISQADNYVWVKDITDPKVIAWQIQSGFTLEELKLIQGAYDNYMPHAFTAPNKFEIPQKPEVKTAYFEDKNELKKNLWFFGEGKNGVLNGKWVQNYAVGVPWIEGYFINGKRSGQWKEYYQGTEILCRTENWQNDKLNGIRRRFDRETGKIVEEILFKNGEAVTKTNIDESSNLKWIRKPIDSATVFTEVYTLDGALLAAGKEKIYNPGNLLWFQNIELTALNSAAITARDINVVQNDFSPFHRKPQLFGSPSLVEYKKEGNWVYYRNSNQSGGNQAINLSTLDKRIISDFQIFGQELYSQINEIGEIKTRNGYDSVLISYENNVVQEFYGIGPDDYTHIKMSYFPPVPAINLQLLYNPYQSQQYQNPRQRNVVSLPRIKEIGQYNQKGLRIGTWKYFNENHELYKTESYLLPHREEKETAKL